SKPTSDSANPGITEARFVNASAAAVGDVIDGSVNIADNFRNSSGVSLIPSRIRIAIRTAFAAPKPRLLLNILASVIKSSLAAKIASAEEGLSCTTPNDETAIP